MGSPAVLSFDELLQPIPGERPAGEDLRADLSNSTAYYQIKDSRTAARNAERQGALEATISATEASAWRPVLAQGLQLLRTRTKDLEIIAWTTEALARVHGFAGLRDGFQLATKIVEQFWDGVYPSPDEDGLETRVAPLTGLALPKQGTLITPIARIPITQGSTFPPLATWSCQQALEIERLSEDARDDRIKQGATSMDVVRTAVRETPVSFFVTLVQDLRECLEAWRTLGAALDERCGSDSPPNTAVREALTAALDSVRLIASDVLPAESEEEVARGAGDAPLAAPSASQPGAPQAGGGKSLSSIQSREDAFRALALVAKYFRTNEPHSPLSFLIERTMRWGQMPLPDLLAELIPDNGAREMYALLTGVNTSTADR
jgi:type VI secretion system protein ImpA